MWGSGSFRSDFGGLWTDRTDAVEVLISLIQQGLSADLVDQVQFWMKINGEIFGALLVFMRAQ